MLLYPKKPENNLYDYAKILIKAKYPKQAYRLIFRNVEKVSAEQLYFYASIFKDNGYLNWSSFLTTKASHIFKYKLSKQTVLSGFHDSYLKMIKDRTDIPLTILSLIKQESGFDSRALSRANAKGLMQIIDRTARSIDKVKAKDLFNEENNLDIGISYFEALKKDLKKDHLALASYNAGPHRVAAWLKHHDYEDPAAFIDLIPFDETRIYVGSILRNKYYYERKLDTKNKGER